MHATYSGGEHFRRGCADLEAGRPVEALEHFRCAQRLDPANPIYRSYHGLCVAIAERRFDRALDLCRSAAKEEFFNANLYHNLARVHLVFGFKSEAIRYLRRGLMIDPRSASIQAELYGLGLRRPPVLGFLRRQNPINRWFGRLRQRFEAMSAPGAPIRLG